MSFTGFQDPYFQGSGLGSVSRIEEVGGAVMGLECVRTGSPADLTVTATGTNRT